MDSETMAGLVAGTVGMIFFAIWLVVIIFYLLTLQKALTRVREVRRAMSPGLVWLNLIPLFNLGWHIYTVIKVSESLAQEFDARQIKHDGKPGFAIGLAASILFITAIIPLLGMFLALAGIVC